MNHLPALKTLSPGAIWSRQQQIRDAELANCQVLCYDCHKAKTLDEFSNVKFPKSLVDQIKSDYETGMFSQKELAEIYGVSSSQVQRYVRGIQRNHTF
jgi:predicted XRE-type DNA-binding protein